MSLFKEKIKEDGHYEETDTDHFENIQSTNWQTMRFKPPPPGDTIGNSTYDYIIYENMLKALFIRYVIKKILILSCLLAA